MKIRIKNKNEGIESNFVYEIDNEKGSISEISVVYLETAIKIMKLASEKVFIKNANAFEKFLINLKRATKYYDKFESKSVETPNVIHVRQSKEEIKEYEAKSLKYDKKAKATFSLHNGWYDNFIDIVEEIKEVLKGSFEDLEDENELLHTANRVDVILDNYRRKQKQKSL